GAPAARRPGMPDKQGLQPPPDNSFERRADRRGEHTARKSVVKGFGEAPQRGYGAPEPLPDPDRSQAHPLDINAELRQALGYGSDPSKPLIGEQPEEAPPERDEISDISEPRREKRHRPSPQPVTLGVGASMQALEKLLREGREEFLQADGTPRVWAPHRPPRP